ncbi:hypothetical protein EVAR_43238_1 [Eumeta japonica]|uniref:Uncharacterized protein n=1 Tax=Eumeta variegata TaxID=151549 RepID=A0A4C1WTB7_EUMVA|nr:hypothetical protein EVAR_43238_1 [Eumeta japonica]
MDRQSTKAARRSGARRGVRRPAAGGSEISDCPSLYYPPSENSASNKRSAEAGGRAVRAAREVREVRQRRLSIGGHKRHNSGVSESPGRPVHNKGRRKLALVKFALTRHYPRRPARAPARTPARALTIARCFDDDTLFFYISIRYGIYLLGVVDNIRYVLPAHELLGTGRHGGAGGRRWEASLYGDNSRVTFPTRRRAAAARRPPPARAPRPRPRRALGPPSTPPISACYGPYNNLVNGRRRSGSWSSLITAPEFKI